MQKAFDIDKLKVGDLKEFELLFTLMYPKLKSLGKRYLPEAIVEDLLQDIFKTYWEQKESFRIPKTGNCSPRKNKTKCFIRRRPANVR